MKKPEPAPVGDGGTGSAAIQDDCDQPEEHLNAVNPFADDSLQVQEANNLDLSSDWEAIDASEFVSELPAPNVITDPFK